MPVPLCECVCLCVPGCVCVYAWHWHFSSPFAIFILSKLRSIEGQANLLRIYRLCKLQKFSNENFNYYVASKGKVYNNSNKNSKKLKMFTCILWHLAVLQKEIERCCDRVECAASRAYDANYAHITHTSRCHRQFPRVACVCAA